MKDFGWLCPHPNIFGHRRSLSLIFHFFTIHSSFKNMTLETQKKNLIFRRLSLALIILLISVLQNTNGYFPQIFGIRALLLIPAVVCIGMYERDMWGLILGLFAGALWDVFASGASFNALFLMSAGFICGTLINTIMRNNIVTASILSFIFSALYNIAYWLFHFVFTKLDSAFFMLWRYYLPGIVYTTVFVPIIFIAVRAVEKKFSEE